MATKAFSIFHQNDRIDHSKVVNQLLSDQHPPVRSKSAPRRPASNSHAHGKVGVAKSRSNKQSNKSENFVSREDLLNQVSDLKKRIKTLEESSGHLKSENQRLEAEATKQQRRIDQLLNLSEGAKNIGLSAEIRRDIEKSILVRQLKMQINHMRDDMAAKDAEMEAIRRNTKATQLFELENERDECYIEIQRLQTSLVELKQELFHEKQRREWSSRVPLNDPTEDLRREVVRLSSGYQNMLTNLSNKMSAARPSTAGERTRRPHSAGATTRKEAEKKKNERFTDDANSPYLADNPYSPQRRDVGSNDEYDDRPTETPNSKMDTVPLSRAVTTRAYVDPLDNFGLAPPESLEGLATVEPIITTIEPEHVDQAPDSDQAVLRKDSNEDRQPPSTNTYRPAASKFSIGSRVEGYYAGGPDWYEGVIRAINPDGTFQVRYDDGDEENYVVQSNLRTPRAALTSAPTNEQQNLAVPDYQVGQVVESLYYNGSKYYRGKVAGVRPSATNPDEFAYDIAYDDGEKELKVPASNIRLVQETLPHSDIVGGEVVKPEPAATTPPIFSCGEKVEGKFQNEASWYKGTIIKVNLVGNQHFYNILYDDGDEENNVEENRIRKLENSTTVPKDSPTSNATVKFKVNDRVSGYFEEVQEWYDGTVLKVNEDGTYHVLYDDGDEETDVVLSRLRTIAVTTTPAGQSDEKYPAVPESNSTKAEEPIETVVDKGPPPRYSVGAKVEALYGKGTVWYNATIQKVNPKKSKDEFTYELLYDDGDCEKNVRESFIKPQSSAAATPAVKTPKFVIGAKVEGLYDGGPTWYPATVQAVHDVKVDETQTYELLYDDGDCEYKVVESNIRAPSKPEHHHHEHNPNNTTLDSFLNEISDDDDDDVGSGNLNAGPAVRGAAPAGEIVKKDDDDMYEDEDFDA